MNNIRVGITDDFLKEIPGIIEPIVDIVFSNFPCIEIEYFDSPHLANRDQIDQYDAIISYHVHYNNTSLQGIKRLAIISRWGVGYDVVDVEACTKNDVILTVASPNGVRGPVAEGILSFIFALTKKIMNRHQLVVENKWTEKSQYLGMDISNLVLGTIGLGNIGSELLRKAKSLGFKSFLATDPYIDPQIAAHLGAELVDLSTLLREADIVSINCPLNHETRYMIGANELKLMKKTSFLINTARGSIVDEKALVFALSSQEIAGAALDVFAQEPISSEHPLLYMPNVILSPHSIAYTQNLITHNSEQACKNILGIFQNLFNSATIINTEVLNSQNLKNKLTLVREKLEYNC